MFTHSSSYERTQRSINSFVVDHRFAMRRICSVNGKVLEDEGFSVIFLNLSLIRKRFNKSNTSNTEIDGGGSNRWVNSRKSLRKYLLPETIGTCEL